MRPAEQGDRIDPHRFLHGGIANGRGRLVENRLQPRLEELERHVRALEALRDVRLIALFAWGILPEGPPYMVLEWLPHSLEQVLTRAGGSVQSQVAARAGAPLGHDFCAISLSDNLKPWELIERRLEAAAAPSIDELTREIAPGRRARAKAGLQAEWRREMGITADEEPLPSRVGRLAVPLALVAILLGLGLSVVPAVF